MAGCLAGPHVAVAISTAGGVNYAPSLSRADTTTIAASFPDLIVIEATHAGSAAWQRPHCERSTS